MTRKATAARQAAAPAAGFSRYIEVPYDHLVTSDTVNARAGDYSAAGVAELAALIKTKGLLQPLVVRAGSMIGHYEIFAGGRRHAAIGALIQAGDWPARQPVPCIERDDDDASALEASLIENIGREAMHPVREYEVFAELHGKGADVEAIGRRYGVSTRIVRQRLALGGMAPEVREAWREGKMGSDAAQAFAVCRDTKRQSAVYRQLAKQGQVQTWQLRQHLGNDRPKLTDARVAFVGLDRYRAAGGAVMESLFADDGWLEDAALLDAMVEARLEERCAELRADGWSFAVPDSEAPGHFSWQRLQPKKAHTAQEKTRLKEIEAEMEDEASVGEVYDALEDECAAIEEAAEARGFGSRQKAQSGCVISLSGDRVEIAYGVVRPKPGNAGTAGTAAAGTAGDDSEGDGAAVGDDVETGEPRISNALLLTLTEQQTVAAARTVAEAPVAALRLAIAGLRSYANPVKLRSEGFRGIGGQEDLGDFVEVLAGLGDDVDLAAEFARAVAHTLDLRLYAPRATLNGSGEKQSQPAPNEALIAALPAEAYLAEMRALFQPEDYFKRAPAVIAHAAIVEMMRADTWVKASMPKADLVRLAVKHAAETGWLPPEVRHPEYALAGVDAEEGAVADQRTEKSRRRRSVRERAPA